MIDQSDGSRTVSNWSWRLDIAERSPGSEFETRVFGPFLVVRSVEPTGSPGEFLSDTIRVQRTQLVNAPVPYWLIANAEINDYTARRALRRLAGIES